MKTKKQVTEEWIANNGACRFDLKNEDIILPDGGLFSIEKIIKMRNRSRLCKLKNGGAILKTIKGKKVKYEDYEAVFWFTELDETINYLNRMKKMLNSIGYKTNTKIRGKGKVSK